MDKETFEKLKPGDWFTFNCLNCGKETLSKKKDTKKGQLDQSRFLCKTCKSKLTFLEKYGVDNPSKSSLIKNKVKEACLEKFGVENVSQIESVKDRISESLKDYQKNLTKSQKDNISKKISLGNLEYWSQLSQEEKDSRLPPNFWESATLESKEAHKEACRQYWRTLTEGERKALTERLTLISKQYWQDISEEKKLEISEKIKESWSKKSTEELREIRRKSKKQYTSEDGETFDSSWELKYYEYCKSKGFSIIREPVVLEFEFESRTHHYIPDFSVNGKLVEIKGNNLKSRNGNWVCPFRHKSKSKEYLDGLYEAKRQCAITNKVTILYEEDLIALGIEI